MPPTGTPKGGLTLLPRSVDAAHSRRTSRNFAYKSVVGVMADVTQTSAESRSRPVSTFESVPLQCTLTCFAGRGFLF
jgi:hypothetical protein